MHASQIKALGKPLAEENNLNLQDKPESVDNPATEEAH
jgi:hypothetical protein